MTTRWPSPPVGQSWDMLDPLLGTLARTVERDHASGEVHQIRWEPPHRAAATYRAVTAPRRDDGEDLLCVEITPAGLTRTALLRDQSLPGIAAALDLAGAQARLEQAYGGTLTVTAVTVVSYRPGSRCVLRYDVIDAVGPHQLFVKVFADGHERFARAAVALAASAVAHGAPIPVPPVLDRWSDLRAVVTRAVPGPTLSRCLADVGAGQEARDLAVRLGELLAVVAGTPLATLPLPLVRPEEDLAEVNACLSAAWYGDAVNASSLVGLRDDLAAAPPQTEPVFGHGAFRSGQVIAGPDGLTLLDLDGACLAQPGRDLGNATAYLVWQGLCSGRPRDDVQALVDAVLRGYQGGGGHVDDAAFRWWQAAAMAKIAGRRYRSLATTEWPLARRLVRTARESLDATPAALRRPVGTSGRDARDAGPRPPTHVELLDPAAMTALLRPALARHARPGQAVEVTAAEVLGAAPGRRVVLRYVVTGLDAGPVPVVGKVFAERGRAAVTHRNLVALSEASVGPVPGTAPLVPLAELADHGMVLYRAATGRPLSDLAEHGLPERDLLHAVRAGVRWLKALHGSAVVLDRRLDLGGELLSLDAWAAEVAAHDGRLADPARSLVQRLRDSAGRLPDGPLAPLHKDFHVGHLLVDDEGRVTVIDLDEARMGDIAFDLAHLLSYLEESRRPWAGAARDAVLDEYAELGGADPESRLAFYRAYTRLKMAKQLVRGSGPLVREWGEVRVEDLALLLGRGSSCVTG